MIKLRSILLSSLILFTALALVLSTHPVKAGLVGTHPVLSLLNDTHLLDPANPFYNTTMNCTVIVFQEGQWSEAHGPVIEPPGGLIDTVPIYLNHHVDDSFNLTFSLTGTMLDEHSGVVGSVHAFPREQSPPQEPPDEVDIDLPLADLGPTQIVMYAYVASIPVGVGSGFVALYPSIIHIREDGSIDPPTTLISTEDNATYVFTSSMYSEIVIERENVVVDGRGFSLLGNGSGRGFTVSNKNNITIANTNIDGFSEGVFLMPTFSSAIIGNNISNCNNAGIYIQSSSNNAILNNRISGSGAWAIALLLSSSNVISGNHVESNSMSIWISASSNTNLITRNNVIGNSFEVGISNSSGNLIFRNNFVNNTQAGLLSEGFINFWDNGYPDGGNYWSRYGGVDLNRGPLQNVNGMDGIGDTPYAVSMQPLFEDRYPLMRPSGPSTPIGANVTVFPNDDVTLIFENVTTEGLTHADKLAAGPTPPAGFIVVQYYEIGTTANFTDNVVVRIVYDDSNMSQYQEESLQLLLFAPTFRGDVDRDYDVDILDIVRLAGAYGTKEGDFHYRPDCDIDNDGDVDILDIVIAAGNYGNIVPMEERWTNITTCIDTENNLIFGIAPHFSIQGVTRHN
jgi:parallel beta-helix repeat protein